jgi:hypothetical protein
VEDSADVQVAEIHFVKVVVLQILVSVVVLVFAVAVAAAAVCHWSPWPRAERSKCEETVWKV